MVGYKGQLASELNRFQNLGVQQGRQNLPSSNAPALDQHEIKLESEAKQCVLVEHATFGSKVNELNKQTTSVEHSLTEIRAKCETLLGDDSLTDDSHHHLAAEQHRLVDLRATELKLQADLNGFKAENGITC